MTNSKTKNKGVKLLAAAMVLAVALAGFVLIADDTSATDGTSETMTVYVGGSDSKDDDSADGSVDKPYATIAYALTKAYKETNSVILEIEGDIEGDGWSNPEGKNLTINFNSYEFKMTGELVGSTYKTQVFQLLKNSNVTFNDGTITTEVEGAAMIIQNYSNLTLNNMVIDGTGMTRTGTYAVSLNNGSISIIGATTIKAANTTNSVAFDAYWWGGNYDDGAKVVVNTTGNIVGNIEVADNGVNKSSTALQIQNAKIEGNIVYTATKGTGVVIGDGVDVDVIIPAGTTASGFVQFGEKDACDKVEFTNLKASSDVTFSKGSVKISGTIDATDNVVITAGGTVRLNGVNVTAEDSGSLEVTKIGDDAEIIIENLTIEEGATLNIQKDTLIDGTLKVVGKVTVADNTTLTVADKAKLVVEGEIDVGTDNSKLENNGTIQITDSKAVLPEVISGNGSVDSSSVASEGTLSGEYNTNTTFTQNQIITVTADTYLIDETVFIVEGKLIIPAGVTLYIQDGARLVVNKSTGYLENNGTIVVESKVDQKTDVAPAGALAIVNGTVENNGTIELAYTEEALDEDDYNNHVSMNNSGTLVNNGEIIVGEDSFLYMWNGFANLGSFTLNGTIMADNGASIINSGVVTLDGTIDMNGAGTDEKVLKIDLKTTDAVVDIVSLTQNDEIDYAGLIVCADALKPSSSSKTYEGTPAVSLKANNGFATEGLKVTVTLVVDKTDATTSYRTLVLSGDVSFSTDLTSYSGTAPVVISTTGNTLVDEALNLSAGVELTVGGPMTVSGTMTSVNDKVLGGNNLGKIIATETITVTGSIVSNEKIGDNTKINAAYYSTSKTTTSSETNTYTTLDKAVSAGATKIEMLGLNTVSADVTIPSGTTVTVSGKTTVGSETTLTFAAGSILKGTADIIVTGTLYVEDKKTALKNSGDIESDVTKDGEKDRTYTNITIALAGAKAGDVVKISKDVTISKNTVIPAGVELDTDGDNEITVENDVTLTVEGTLFLNNGTLKLEERVNESESAAAMEAGKLELNGVIKSTSSIDALKIVGAYYTITDKIDTYYYVQPVADAAGLISTVDGAKITIRSWGTDLAIGDISFVGTADKEVTVTVEGKLSAGTITIENASVEFGSDAFIGKITDSVGTITLNGTAYGFTVASATSDSTKTFIITGKFLAESEKVTLEGTSTVKGFTSDNVVVDGNVTITGETATTINDLTVNGTIVVENKVSLKVNGNLNVLGSVDAKVATSTSGAGNVSAENVYVGLTKKAVTGAAASASGSFTISGFLYVADGSSIPAKLVDGKKSLQVFVEDKLWMTIYTMGSDDKVEIKYIPVEDVKLDSWVKEDGSKATDDDDKITVDNNKVYAKIVYDVYDVKIIVCSGIDNVYIDGVLAGETTKVAAGEHTISYTLANGYTGTATMLVNGEKVTGYKFTASGAFSDETDAEPEYKITLQGIEASEPTTPVTPVQPIVSSDDDDMGLTEYLLIVLVILAAILVVVVAIRMMRS